MQYVDYDDDVMYDVAAIFGVPKTLEVVIRTKSDSVVVDDDDDNGLHIGDDSDRRATILTDSFPFGREEAAAYSATAETAVPDHLFHVSSVRLAGVSARWAANRVCCHHLS